MPVLFRVLVAIVLLGNLAVLIGVAVGTARRAPGWVALHYAPVEESSRCEAAATRLRAALRREGGTEPTEAQEALLEGLRWSGDCADGPTSLSGVAAALGLEPLR